MAMQSKGRNLQPLRGLAKATAACSAQVRAIRGKSSLQAQVYGQCMLAKYKEIEKDACAREFLEFKACVQKEVGRSRWQGLPQLGRKW